MKGNSIFGNDRIVQIGIRVKDLDEAAGQWAAVLGKDPVMSITDGYEITGAKYRGKPCHGLIRQALFDLDNIQIELIAPCDEEATGWSEGMNEKGEGLHHIAVKVDNFDEVLTELNERGFDTIQRGTWQGEAPGQYAYVDSENSLKTIIELLQY